MGSRLHNLALIHDIDAVRMANGGQAMGNGNSSSIVGDLP